MVVVLSLRSYLFVHLCFASYYVFSKVFFSKTFIAVPSIKVFWQCNQMMYKNEFYDRRQMCILELHLKASCFLLSAVLA